MSKYRLTDLPTSPLRGDDKLVVNRKNVSHKIDASDLVYFLAQIELPIVTECLLSSDCPDGFVCVDGKCERLSCDADDFCPLGYTCINDFCYKLCNSTPECGDGYVCVDYLNDGNGICVPYPFPCDSENGCPPGYECYEGFCLQTCSGSGDCPEGSECITVDIITDNGIEQRDYCIPYPFPCGSIGEFPTNSGCPPEFYCYGGECHPVCSGDSDCEPGYHCHQIGNENNNEGNDGGNPISICLPNEPVPGLVNDGKLNIVDDQNNRRVIFSANQYGDTFLKFNGIDIDGNNGGGSGSIDLNFRTLWERTDPSLKDSDIEPTYENVDILPNGTDSNVGSDSLRWNTLYTHDLHIDEDVIGTLKPNPTLGYDLGSTNQRWGTTFTQDLNITKDVIGTLKPHPTLGYDLGSENQRWGTTFTQDLNISGIVEGNLIPKETNTFNVGTSSQRWKNVYTNDLNLSNEGSSNDVDGTWGDYTIQEGEDDLFIINNRSGKKYRFKLEEV